MASNPMFSKSKAVEKGTEDFWHSRIPPHLPGVSLSALQYFCKGT